MLKTIRLKNFKLHDDTQIDAAPITVFIGPNNSGKSSIAQALLALRAAAKTSSFLAPVQRIPTSPGQPFLFTDGSLLDLGGFDEVVRHGQNEVEIGVSGELNSRARGRYFGHLDVGFEVSIRRNALIRHSGSLEYSSGRNWKWKFSIDPPNFQEMPRIDLEGGQVVLQNSNNFNLLSFQQVLPMGARSPEETTRLTEMGQQLAGAPHSLISSIHHVYPLRGFEEWGCPSPKQKTDNIERAALPDRAVAMASMLGASLKLRRQVSARLKEMLGLGIEVEFFDGDRIKVFATSETSGGTETLLVNEGTGANQLPFILVPIALAAQGETVLLSEPEAHLHPKAQCDLMRQLLSVAKRENIQFFFETHSEHVLHVILNAIGKGEWGPNEVAIYSFENDRGTAKVNRLEVDEQGGVRGGIPGFFDQSLDELTEYLETVKKPTA